MTTVAKLIAQTIRLATSVGTTDIDTLAERIADALNEHAVEPIAALRAEFAEAHADGASSNDIVQLLDDWLVKHGQPTVLYA
jgi:hypothetical protein